MKARSPNNRRTARLPLIVIGLALLLQSSLWAHAQEQILTTIASIKPMTSTKEDVRKSLGEGEKQEDSTWYYFPKISVEVMYSDGECTEHWLAQKDTVIEVIVFFRDQKKFSDLATRVNLKKLRLERSLDGDRLYYDDRQGIKYVVDSEKLVWSSMTYYPPEKYSRCED